MATRRGFLQSAASALAGLILDPSFSTGPIKRKVGKKKVRYRYSAAQLAELERAAEAREKAAMLRSSLQLRLPGQKSTKKKPAKKRKPTRATHSVAQAQTRFAHRSLSKSVHRGAQSTCGVRKADYTKGMVRTIRLRSKPRRADIGQTMRVRKTDEDRQIVYGEVYIPNMPDSHGEMMLPEDVENMAHNFLREVSLSRSIDTGHDNWPNGSCPVESFIARNMPPYEEGAWVLGVQITDERLWKRVKKGELAGFSFEGRAKKQKALVEIEYQPTQIGFTEPDPEDGHVHAYVLKVNEMGKVIDGSTSEVNGHSHSISRGTATDAAEDHKHRYFIK